MKRVQAHVGIYGSLVMSKLTEDSMYSWFWLGMALLHLFLLYKTKE